MKKKLGIILLVIALITVIAIIGISLLNRDGDSTLHNSTNTSTITTKNGEIVELTAKELKKVYDDNPAIFERDYQGAEILFVGTISEIKYGFYKGNGRIMLDLLKFNEGYDVYLLHDSFDMTKFNKGDNIIVSSNIYSMLFGIDIRGTSGGTSYNENTLKSTILENVTGKNEEEINTIKESIIAKKEIYYSLDILKDELDFISKYAGNVSKSGSRKFADERLEALNSCLVKNYNFDKISNPDIRNKVENIINESKNVYDMVVDMGNTNSDENVSTIKTNAINILSSIKELSKDLYGTK